MPLLLLVGRGRRGLGRNLALLMLLLGSVLALPACGPQADARTVVEVFVSSLESDDINAAASVLAPDVQLRAPNELGYRGLEAVRQWLAATLSEYAFEPSEAPSRQGADIAWSDNFYSRAGHRWVGEIGWRASVHGTQIVSLIGTVRRGASGIICPQCPPGTRI